MALKEIYNHYMRMLALSLRQHLGRRFYFIPWFVLVWPCYHAIKALGSGPIPYSPADAQNELIGLPIYFLSIGLGVRIVASEVEKRTLEVAYTLPSGAGDIWRWKIISSLVIILWAIALLAVTTWIFFTPYPIDVLYRVMQGALFFLVFSMSAGALLGTELIAALVSGALLLTLYPQFYGVRWSPIFDPLFADVYDNTKISFWLFQNYVWVLTITVLIGLYTFFRVEQREHFLT